MPLLLEVCKSEKPSGSAADHCGCSDRFGLTRRKRGIYIYIYDAELRCLTCHRTGWVMISRKYWYLYLEVLIASLTLLERLANKATNQILISVLDFFFLFASCHLPWTYTKRACLASWEDMHTQMTVPRPILHSLCYSWCCRWRELGLSCLLSSCPNYGGKTAAEVGVSFKTLARAPTFPSHQSGGELMPACDYLSYRIYGKVTYEAMLDTSQFVSEIAEILKSSIS